MKNRIFKILCFTLVTVICFVGVGNEFTGLITEVNAEPAPVRVRFEVEAEEYESFFADFL